MAPSRYELLDVSMWMDDFVFPGDAAVEIEGPYDVVGTDNPEWVYTVCTPTQAGTHVQGAHYFLETGATIDTYPLDRFEGWAHVVDVAADGTDTQVADVESALGDRDLSGQIILLRSGHLDTVIEAGELDSVRPGLSIECARWLIEQGVSMVAIDSVGLESRNSENFDVNVALCQAGILILEGLVGLDRITVPRVWLEAFPLKLRGVEGTPCRAVVKVPLRG